MSYIVKDLISGRMRGLYTDPMLYRTRYVDTILYGPIAPGSGDIAKGSGGHFRVFVDVLIDEVILVTDADTGDEDPVPVFFGDEFPTSHPGFAWAARGCKPVWSRATDCEPRRTKWQKDPPIPESNFDRWSEWRR